MEKKSRRNDARKLAFQLVAFLKPKPFRKRIVSRKRHRLSVCRIFISRRQRLGLGSFPCFLRLKMRRITSRFRRVMHFSSLASLKARPFASTRTASSSFCLRFSASTCDRKSDGLIVSRWMGCRESSSGRGCSC